MRATPPYPASDTTTFVVATKVVSETRGIGTITEVVVVTISIADNDIVAIGRVEHLTADTSVRAAGLSDAVGEVTDVVAADIDLVVVLVAELKVDLAKLSKTNREYGTRRMGWNGNNMGINGMRLTQMALVS